MIGDLVSRTCAKRHSWIEHVTTPGREAVTFLASPIALHCLGLHTPVGYHRSPALPSWSQSLWPI